MVEGRTGEKAAAAKDFRAIPAAASSMPPPTSSFGPIRGISTMLAIWANTITVAIVGRNATPVFSGEYPRIVCR